MPRGDSGAISTARAPGRGDLEDLFPRQRESLIAERVLGRGGKLDGKETDSAATFAIADSAGSGHSVERRSRGGDAVRAPSRLSPAGAR